MIGDIWVPCEEGDGNGTFDGNEIFVELGDSHPICMSGPYCKGSPPCVHDQGVRVFTMSRGRIDHHVLRDENGMESMGVCSATDMAYSIPLRRLT